MIILNLLAAALVSSGLVHSAALQSPRADNTAQGRLHTRQENYACLDLNAIQSASGLTGQEEGTKGVRPGQSPSKM